MITFWERATHSVDRKFSIYYVHVYLLCAFFNFYFEGRIVVLIAPVTGNCSTFTFEK